MGFDRGEGYVSVMGDVEASASATFWQQGLIEKMDAKRHDTRPETCRLAKAWFSVDTPVKKRSMRRAYNRACSSGLAWYKGRCYTPQDFPTFLQRAGNVPTVPGTPPNTHAEYNRRNQDARRMRVFHWNAGGLASPKLDEVKIWLETQQIEVALVTETRMTFEGEWSDARWHHIHTGQPGDRGGGIMCLISRKLCQSQQIRWRPVLTGRLLHVQIHTQPRYFDIVGCYQFAQGHNVSRKTERKNWWDHLENFLQGLSNRHTLFLAGDFNTSLPQYPSHAGPSQVYWRQQLTPGVQHEEQGRFMSLLRLHGLVALNTWDPKLGPTFQTEVTCSRIDYMITRKPMADGCSKQIRYVWDAPFCSNIGHAPMVGLLRKHWFVPATDVEAQTVGQHQRQMGLLAFHQNSDQWQQFTAATCQQILPKLINAQPSDEHLIEDIHQIACHAYHTWFPRHGTQLNGNDAAHHMIMTKWQHRHEMLKYLKPTIAALFRTWFHVAKFQCLKRQAQQHSKTVRKHRFQEVTEQAAEAAYRHDAHALFRIINRFSPKQPKRRMQLRNSQGHIANPVEETAMLKHFIHETWHGPQQFPVMTPPLTGLPFSVEELEQALRDIPATKAVARPCAPSPVWKALAASIAQPLHDLLWHWFVGPSTFIPPWFKDSWMLLIPKPNKPPVNPRALRPLALQEPIGKAIVGLLASKAQLAILPSITSWPIWSYLPRRSTQDALLRVSQHCRAVRDLIAAHRSTPFSRAQGLTCSKVSGGIGIFLDIERAFDHVNRPQLFAKLVQVGIPTPIAHLLTLWHQNTGYHLYSHGAESRIKVGRGLRQGCKAAPLLWNVYVLLFLSELSTRVDSTWLHACVNFYADDGQLGSTFQTAEELTQLIRNLCITLHLLQEFGMTINASKCTALLALAGTAQRKFRAQITCHREGKDWLLLADAMHDTIWIPINTTVKYLGVIMSYRDMEDRTMRHRIQLSRIAHHRLKRWLQGKRGLPMQQRFKLWSNCIYPILSYGICTVGITYKGLHLFQQHVYASLRQIIGDHAYITRHRHSQALSTHGIALPLERLLTTVEALLQSTTQRLLHVDPADIIHTLSWQHLHELKAHLEQTIATGPTASVLIDQPSTGSPEPVYQCLQCAFRTTTVAAFRSHCTTVHGYRMNRSNHVNPTHFMVNGLPQCKYCLKKFILFKEIHHLENLPLPHTTRLPGHSDWTTRVLGACIASSARAQPCRGPYAAICFGWTKARLPSD